MNPQRIALVPLNLKHGLEIPKGTRIAWRGHHHSNDPDHVQDPAIFDPMRNYRKRRANKGEFKTKYTAGQIDSNYLSFGYGNQACPGRYFAVSEILLMLAKLVLEFEFKHPEGKTRPKTMYADESVFLDPHATVMMRRRGLQSINEVQWSFLAHDGKYSLGYESV